MIVPRCKFCRFFDVNPPLTQYRRKPPAEGLGLCRRHAPGTVDEHYIMPRWPAVAESDWCGEFEAQSAQDVEDDGNRTGSNQSADCLEH
jgi:hypothetical protein